MNCIKCGTHNNDGSKFCTCCGAPMGGNSFSQYAGASVNTGYAGQTAGSSPVQYSQYGQPVQNASMQYSPMYNQPQSYNPSQQYNQFQPYNQMQPYNQCGQQSTRVMTIDQFIKLPSMKNEKILLIIGLVICYFAAVVTLISQMSADNFPVDAVILGALGAWIHVKKNYVASIILLIYGIINMIYIIIAFNMFSGWLIVVSAVCCVIATYKTKEAYKEYTARGMIASNCYR